MWCFKSFCPTLACNIPGVHSRARQLREWEHHTITRPCNGLHRSRLETTGQAVTGAEMDESRLQIRCRHHEIQEQQRLTVMWMMHTGETMLPPMHKYLIWHRIEMCPAGIATATSHPAGAMLANWSQLGCPTETGQPWSKQEMWEAVPHNNQ